MRDKHATGHVHGTSCQEVQASGQVVVDGRYTPTMAGMVKEAVRLYEGQEVMAKEYAAQFRSPEVNEEEETRRAYLRMFYENRW